MIGLILAGGKSQNLHLHGELTTLSTPGGKTMAQLAYSKLTELALTTYLSVRRVQPDDLQRTADIPVILDNSSIHAEGPLLGLLSAHRKFPMDDIFLLACNMPLIKTAYLHDLFDLWLDKISDIYVYQKSGRAVPFCGIYSFQALRQMDKMVSLSQKKETSLQYYIQRLNTCYMHIPEEAASMLQLINSEEELSQLIPGS